MADWYRPIDGVRLYKTLGFPGYKVPKDFQGRFENFAVYDCYLEQSPIGSLTIIVYPTRRNVGSVIGRNRVYCLCPNCGREVSLWQLCKHYGNDTCFRAALLKDMSNGADIIPPGDK